MNFGKIDKWIFFGGGSLITSAANYLKNKADVAVVTAPRQLNASLQRFSDDPRVDFHVIESLSELPESFITDTSIGISSGGPWIFTRKFLNKFGGKVINFHGFRLPQDAGGGGISWRIMRGDRMGHNTIHIIDPGIDSGNIIHHEEYVFPDGCRLPVDYMNELDVREFGTFVKLAERIKNGEDFTEINQPAYLGSYWPRLNTKIHGFIDWSWSLEDIERFICAFDDPYTGAKTKLADDTVALKKVYRYCGDGTFHPFQTGIVYRKNDGKIFVAHKEGSLIVGEVIKYEKENIIDSIRVGDRFFPDTDALQNATKYRAIYTARGLK